MVKTVRSERGRALRSIKERLLRNMNYKLPQAHDWMGAFCKVSTLEELKEASERLSKQEKYGMNHLHAHVLGTGDTPDGCKATVEGLPEFLTGIPNQELYMRLCEMESLRVALSEEQWKVFKELQDRGFLVENPETNNCDQSILDSED